MIFKKTVNNFFVQSVRSFTKQEQEDYFKQKQKERKEPFEVAGYQIVVMPNGSTTNLPGIFRTSLSDIKENATYDIEVSWGDNNFQGIGIGAIVGLKEVRDGKTGK
ncbi:MAG: hypothetical protein H6626_05740 [Pseudobdellovibrionaceae bacterium]|nr:hypothetical protein [Bdellovibrionales bacterium]USN48596.1 MAG: hypothetical protein H6626_05740 [Pseudobdellovibrionaceae bacterium]